MGGKKRFFSSLCVITFIMGAIFIVAFISQEQKAKEQYIHETNIGNVTFLHLKHQERMNNDCQVCHLSGISHEKPIEACSNCHKKKLTVTPEGDIIPLSKAFHSMCIKCHQQKIQEEKKGPVKCQECHIK